MNNKTMPFVIGLIATAVVLSVIMLYFSQGKTASVPTASQIIDQNDIQKIKDNSVDLKNFGNLPAQVSQDDIGRGNPFESY
jgi:hypothetical protein